ncbi:adenine DNA glycosylase [Gammaproteobacteria bacterium]
MALSFSRRLLAWYDEHGRHDLPWQRSPTPYLVWISEIMLQQTRVATVIPYFEKFTARFPNLNSLAAAPLDEVLAFWSGLGYYARARHLHRAAQKTMTIHGGELPTDIDTLRALPGVGRSTAAAILALTMDARHPILDGNVKRVLARYHAIPGWPGETRVAQHLWNRAETHTPHQRVASYTQAIMDLGATVCTRTRPACTRCPIADDCQAYILGQTSQFPGSRPKRVLPSHTIIFILLLDSTNAVFLERRPEAGIWGGLWAFPECPLDQNPVAWLARTHGIVAQHLVTWEPVRHTLTHLHLDITPWLGRAQGLNQHAITTDKPKSSPICQRDSMAADTTLWYNPRQVPPGGFAAPVARLLARLNIYPLGEK